jgi:pimeloyl-ACP methyl ester carboxylesterase
MMRIENGRITLELRELTDRPGPALLLLHALYGSSAAWGEVPAAWPGKVYALDFTGHGRSGHLLGGGYSPELFVADADTALARIGGAAVAGCGIGAYVAVLLAGTRSESIPAALLIPGAGLFGAGAAPDPSQLRLGPDQPQPGEPASGDHDPMARVLDRDVRPPDYAEAFANAARRLLLVEDGEARPPWWLAVRKSAGGRSAPADLRRAFEQLASIVA